MTIVMSPRLLQRMGPFLLALGLTGVATVLLRPSCEGDGLYIQSVAADDDVSVGEYFFIKRLREERSPAAVVPPAALCKAVAVDESTDGVPSRQTADEWHVSVLIRAGRFLRGPPILRQDPMSS